MKTALSEKTVKKTSRSALGATLDKRGGVSFNVWAPRVQKMDVRVYRSGKTKDYEMKKNPEGYFFAHVKDAAAGNRYSFVLDGENERPDPASRFQPDGVHGPSGIVDPRMFRWSDRSWRGLDLKKYIIYEIHAGTFTKEGTFDGAVKKLPYLKKLGVTCVELMPVSQFPGKRNWGYDGVDLYAVQNSYGGPDGLKRLVNACHRHGLAVCLDVVYNHFGPEGNYLHGYGNYFTSKYHTPWGDAVNYDDVNSAHVRRFIAGNAAFWIREYHIDALRLDAVHGIYDAGPKHILEEIRELVDDEGKRQNRKVYVIAESDLNDSKIIRPGRQKGYGLAAQWSDDFHHALHTELTHEKSGYYQDFYGLPHVVKAVRDAFVYDGVYSKFRGKDHGNQASDLPGEKFVIFTQNHDQVGNRALGDRLNAGISFEAQKLAAAVLLLSPYTPLLFMGQEYGETAPFQYFVDHGDEHLMKAVREGRVNEFRSFGWKETPDPGSSETFQKSKLKWNLTKKENTLIFSLYQDLIRLRKTLGILEVFGKSQMKVRAEEGAPVFWLEYSRERKKPFAVIFSFDTRPYEWRVPGKFQAFSSVLDTAAKKYGGKNYGKQSRKIKTVILAPQSAVLGFLK